LFERLLDDLRMAHMYLLGADTTSLENGAQSVLTAGKRGVMLTKTQIKAA
jgi:hypothetical protein